MAPTSSPEITRSPPGPANHASPLPYFKILLVGALAILLYGGTVAYLVSDWWTHSDHSYGLLIPPLVLYLIWMERKIILATPVLHDGRGLFLTLVACVMCLAGRLGADLFLQRVSIVVFLAGLIWTFWGRRRLRRLAFPLVLLATMVPLPLLVYNTLSSPLRLFASETATSLSRMLDVTVYRDGNVIHLANISLGVEDACSGLNSLAALLIGALLVGRLHCGRLWKRALLLLLATPLAVAVNILRVTGTAILSDAHQEFALGFYHSFSGWLVFLIGIAGLFGMASALQALFGKPPLPSKP